MSLTRVSFPSSISNRVNFCTIDTHIHLFLLPKNRCHLTFGGCDERVLEDMCSNLLFIFCKSCKRRSYTTGSQGERGGCCNGLVRSGRRPFSLRGSNLSKREIYSSWKTNSEGRGASVCGGIHPEKGGWGGRNYLDVRG